MDVIFPVKLLHIGIINKDEAYEHIDGSLLCEPEAKGKPPDSDCVKRFYEQDPAPIGNNGPYSQKKRHKGHILPPIFLQVFTHDFLLFCCENCAKK